MSNAELVFQSYGRACSALSFFEDFYLIFMNKAPEVRAHFTETDMPAQRHLLRSGILWLIMHARGMSDSKIKALGKSHSKAEMNINPLLYHFWMDALMETLGKHDKEFDDRLEKIWRNTLQPSIDIIKNMHDQPADK